MATKKKQHKSTPPTSPCPTPKALPEIVRCAESIANTERSIIANAGQIVGAKERLDTLLASETALKRVLTGLHREMDRFTAGTRLH